MLFPLHNIIADVCLLNVLERTNFCVLGYKHVWSLFLFLCRMLSLVKISGFNIKEGGVLSVIMNE
jgi:hypothetical protein